LALALRRLFAWRRRSRKARTVDNVEPTGALAPAGSLQ
jgi:hypothetical protein